MEQKTDRLLLIDLQRAEIDLDYSDCLTLVISTSLIINFPRPRFAVLPISLGVTLSGLSGTVRDGHHSLSVQPASLTFFLLDHRSRQSSFPLQHLPLPQPPISPSSFRYTLTLPLPSTQLPFSARGQNFKICPRSNNSSLLV
jgi:hypothetical protein